MKLNVVQKVVFAAIALFLLAVFADVLDIINMPNASLLAALPLTIVAYSVLPSLKQIEQQSRRR
jgi:hypothetical protein